MKYNSLLNRLLSGDTPRSRWLSGAIVLLLAVMVVAPLVGAGQPLMNALARVAIFIILVASFDLLLGYTGLISFAHTMFFGIGAYGVGLCSHYMGAGAGALIVGVASSLLIAMALAAVVGACSMRVRAIFFAMITLAVASVFAIIVTQYYEITGGHDGRNFQLPRALRPSNVLIEPSVLGTAITGSTAVYFATLATSAVCFLVMLRLVNSPFGRALEAIRENEFRAQAVGVNVLRFRIVINCVAAAFACVAGCLYAIWVRYVSPETTMGAQVMLDILLMTIIGGMGTLYGAIVGATLFVVAETYLKGAIAALSPMADHLPVLSSLINPDRWIFWLGLMFVFCVYYFPEGIVGRLRKGKKRWVEEERL
jgi:branched-chain amino acid transport system permease protein